MIILHQDQVAGFAGGHVYYWIGQPLLSGSGIAVTSGAPPVAAVLLYKPVFRSRRR